MNRKIPATVRNAVWCKYINKKKDPKCLCCNIEPITKGNFECGHIKSHKDGGKINIHNLRPICSLCNKSMGRTNMNDFMNRYGFNKNEAKEVHIKTDNDLHKILCNHIHNNIIK